MALVACLVVILGIAAVSANDLNESDISTINDEIIEITEDNDDIEINDDKLCVEEDVEIVSANYTPHTSDEIQSCIDNANKGDTIVLDGYYLINSTINVKKTINFVGINDATLDGNNCVRLFYLSDRNGKVTFSNIVFKNGFSNENGGAIRSEYNDFSVDNCTFINNSVNKQGGAIYGYYCDYDIIDSIFINNTANNAGALNQGTYSNCRVVNCYFRGNHASEHCGAMGGGTAENCTFIGNTAGNDAGAASITAFNCIFINNSAKDEGGAMSGGVADNCTFIGNSAEEGGAIEGTDTVKNSIFINNSAKYGGALREITTSVNCTFINNTASIDGGAIEYGSAKNCTFRNNYAPDGGAIYQCTAINCIFINNTAKRGGSICGKNSFANISTFINNSAVNGGAIYEGSVENCTFNNNNAQNGGAIYECTALNCTFTNNEATQNGGAQYGGFASYSNFSHNRAENKGGAVYNGIIANSLFEYNSAVDGGAMSGTRVSNSTFNHNAATNFGGGVYNAKVSTNSKFKNNTAKTGSDTYEVSFFEIGNSFADLNQLINSNTVIYLNSNYTFELSLDSSFENGIYINHSLTIYGNGYMIDGENFARIFDLNSTDVVFYDIIFANGKTTGNGGALNGDCTAINCTFINNYAGSYGGAIYRGSALNCTFIGNSADCYGGAIYRDSYDEGRIAMNCRFIGNSAVRDGGAIYGVNATNCIFINNTAESGGAIAKGYSGPLTTKINALNCTFINNFAHYGGAMNAYSSCYAINCSFINNSADRQGGAMMSNTAVNCYFENNSLISTFNLGYGGGAVFGGLSLNCTFKSNSGSFGSVICRGKANNCTFISNYGNVIYYGDAVNCSFLNGGSMQGGSAINCTFNNSVGMFVTNVTNCLFVNSNSRVVDACELVNCKFINNTGGAMSRGRAVNCTFINNSADSGGAVSGGTVVNCIFINNSAVAGGAMYGGTALNCTFVNNSADYGGVAYFGGFDHYGGYLYIANMINCTFVNNSAKYGGVISSHWQEHYSGGETIQTINVTNCIFINNSATFDGGAIEISHPFRLFNISDCIFINISSENYGGAIYSRVGNLSNSRFINCSSNQGAAIWTISNLNVIYCNFTNCISDDGSSYLGSNNLSLYNVTDCVFDVDPKGIKYHYTTFLKVNSVYIAKGDRGFLYANLSNIAGPVANKKINFMFNGRKFYSTTNNEGIAEFNVNNYLNTFGKTLINLSFTGDELNNPSSTNTSVYIINYFGNLTVSLDGRFYNDTYLKFKLVNSKTNVPISNASLQLNFSNDEIVYLTTDFEGNAIYRIPFIPDTYHVSAYVNDDYVDVNNVSVDNIVIKKLIGDIEVIPLNDYHTLKIRLFDPEDSSAVYRNVKINLDVGPNPIVNEELFTNEQGYVIYDLLNFTKGTYSISVSVRGDYKDFYDYFLADYVISNLLNSTLNFTNIITFEFGEFGSTNFTVGGATVEYGKIMVVDHPEAIIGLSNNVISVSHLSVGNYTLMVETTPDEYHNPINQTLSIVVTNAKSKVRFSTGIVFEYGGSISIHVIVEGGTVERKNIKIVGHPEASLVLKGNIITVSGLAVGNYNLQVTSTPDKDHIASTETVRVTVKKATAVIKASKITVAYKKAGQWTIKFVDSKSGKAISNMKVTLKVYTGKKYKTVTLTTNSKGEATYQTKKLAKGNHKVVVSTKDNRYNFNTFTSSIKVIKQTAVIFKLQKRENDKNGALISYIVMNKKTKKGINGVKIKLMIYTGKKVQTVTLKTKKSGKYNGAMGFATNELSVGKHNVVIKPASIKYGGSAKTSMIIKKAAKKRQLFSHKL